MRFFLCERYPYWELFWSVSSHIRTEYEEIRSICLYTVRMRENTDENNSYTFTQCLVVPSPAKNLLFSLREIGFHRFSKLKLPWTFIKIIFTISEAVLYNKAAGLSQLYRNLTPHWCFVGTFLEMSLSFIVRESTNDSSIQVTWFPKLSNQGRARTNNALPGKPYTNLPSYIKKFICLRYLR